MEPFWLKPTTGLLVLVLLRAARKNTLLTEVSRKNCAGSIPVGRSNPGFSGSWVSHLATLSVPVVATISQESAPHSDSEIASFSYKALLAGPCGSFIRGSLPGLSF